MLHENIQIPKIIPKIKRCKKILTNSVAVEKSKILFLILSLALLFAPDVPLTLYH